MLDIDKLVTRLQSVGAQARVLRNDKLRGSAEDVAALGRVADELRVTISEFQPAIKTVLDRPSSDALEVSEIWLSAWFSTQIIEIDFLTANGVPWRSDVTSSPQVSLNHALSFAEHMANFLRYVLHYFVAPKLAHTSTLPDAPSFALSDLSLIFLLCEWSHYKGVPRSIPIRAWLERMYQPELALYSVAKKGAYRQHLFHVQDVCLLGLVMLNAQVDDKPFADVLCKGRSAEELVPLWCLCSLLHDIGQLAEIIPRSASYLRGSGSKPLQWLGIEAESAVNELGKRLNNEYSMDPTSSRIAPTLSPIHHARVGAAIVFSRLSESLRSATLDEFIEAVGAILEHDASKGSLDSSVDPLAALLVVCDQLQEFGRTRLESRELSAQVLSYLHRNTGSAAVELKPLNPPASLVAHEVAVKSGILQFPKTIEFSIDLGITNRSVVEPRVVWLDACRRLQRLTCFPDMRITYLNHIPATTQSLELDRIFAFAESRSSTYGSLLEWGRLAATGMCGLQHELKKLNGGGVDDVIESLTFFIPELGKRLPLACGVDDLYTEMSIFSSADIN